MKSAVYSVVLLVDFKSQPSGRLFKKGRRYFARDLNGNFELTHNISKERAVFAASEVAL